MSSLKSASQTGIYQAIYIIMKNSAPPTTLKDRFTEPKGFEWLYFERLSAHDSATSVRKIRVGHLATENAVKTAVILPGLSEFGEKYFELIRELHAQNISAYVIDWFGQGKSGRYLSNPHKRHSYGFSEDIADLNYAIKNIIRPQNDARLIMIGHSMGGNIGLRYLAQNPDIFSSAAFTAPMIGIKEAAIIPRCIASAIFAVTSRFFNASYVPGHSDWRIELREDYGRNIFSSDPVRDRIHNFWCETEPKLQQGGVTWGWVHAAMQSCGELQNSLKHIKTPTLIAQAGKDKIVDNKAMSRTAQAIDAEIMRFEDAHHEIFMERDEIRRPLIEAILQHNA